MFRILLLVMGVAVMQVLTAESEKYSDKYDHIDVTAVLANDRKREQYYKCLISTGPCITSDAKFMKAVFAEAIVTKCMKCTERQKEIFGEIVEWYTTNQEEKWKVLLAKAFEEAKAAKDAKTP